MIGLFHDLASRSRFAPVVLSPSGFQHCDQQTADAHPKFDGSIVPMRSCVSFHHVTEIDRG